MWFALSFRLEIVEADWYEYQIFDVFHVEVLWVVGRVWAYYVEALREPSSLLRLILRLKSFTQGKKIRSEIRLADW